MTKHNIWEIYRIREKSYRHAAKKRLAYVSDPLLRQYGKSPLDTRERLIPVIIASGKTENRFLSPRGSAKR
eukprot:5599723-Pleurochrysis_carterae.AAC.2